MSIARPTYAAAFRCIGASCEDACCGDWDIPLDSNTYRKYLGFPPGELGSLVSQFVSINPAGSPEGLYAQLHRGPSGVCPFYGPDRLCGIQREYGPGFLSATCSIYPRSLSRVAGTLEGSLSLSCPEAARNILLDPDFMQVEGDLHSGGFRTDNTFYLATDSSKAESFYFDLRRLIIEMVKDRSRPMWKRLLLVGSLCKRLDEAGSADGFPEILGYYRQSLGDDLVRSGFEDRPANPRLKLEVVFELTDARLRDDAGPRFQDTFWSFVECVGAPEGSAPEADLERFRKAEEQYHRPFFETFPFILENYLVNYMFQNLFPYGRAGSADFAEAGIFEEYLQMTTQFAWVNALLVGVAGSYKEDFAGEHVVKTIQSFTRTVEHYPDILKSIREYMKVRGLDSLEGMAVMLKGS